MSNGLQNFGAPWKNGITTIVKVVWSPDDRVRKTSTQYFQENYLLLKTNFGFALHKLNSEKS